CRSSIRPQDRREALLRIEASARPLGSRPVMGGDSCAENSTSIRWRRTAPKSEKQPAPKQPDYLLQTSNAYDADVGIWWHGMSSAERTDTGEALPAQHETAAGAGGQPGV